MKRLFVKALKKMNLLPYFNFTFSIKINHRRIKIPVIRSVGAGNLSISEPWMIQLINKLLQLKEGSFIDVGVNIGQTLLKLKAVNPDLSYVGFEPNPVCNFYLSELIRANKYKNVVLYPFAIAENTGVLELNYFSDDLTDSGASIMPNFRSIDKIERKDYIPCFNYSDLNLTLSGKISIIKIDIEGAELEVLNGFYDLIKEQRPLLILEILPVYNKNNQDRFNRQCQIEVLFRDMNYTIIRILKSNKGELRELKKIESIGVHEKIEWSDYLFCPNELTSLLAIV